MTSLVNDSAPRPNLYLVGLMGTGKSTIGKILAKKLGMEFMDSDEAIERSSGMTISEIFADFGEGHFRELERKFILYDHPSGNCLVACGGGLCVPPGMLEALKERGKVICLWASPETLLGRTITDKKRPLLEVSKPLDVLRKLLIERESRYRESDIIIHTDGLSIEEVVERVLADLN